MLDMPMAFGATVHNQFADKRTLGNLLFLREIAFIDGKCTGLFLSFLVYLSHFPAGRAPVSTCFARCDSACGFARLRSACGVEVRPEFMGRNLPWAPLYERIVLGWKAFTKRIFRALRGPLAAEGMPAFQDCPHGSRPSVTITAGRSR
jgi:hypothetical protein